MKEWLSAREIAEERLPDLPTTKAGIVLFAQRESWNEHPLHARPRAGRGGGMEYHISLLPVVAQVAYRQRHLQDDAAGQPQPAPKPLAQPGDLGARAALERDARLAILNRFDRFQNGLGLGQATRLQIFVDRYNMDMIPVEGWVREIVPQLSKRTLTRWRSRRKDGQGDSLAVDRGAARRGTGVLESANQGKVRAFILALLAVNPKLTAGDIRTQCRSEFGDTVSVVSRGVERQIDMPPVRTFQYAIKGLKAVHRVELLKLTDPDRFRSTMALSGVGTLRHVTEPNQLWQIDASPVDALCTDGRHAIYAAIDIATRRAIFLLSRTPRAAAVALLVRKAILAWGVPELIKTDNGSDFTARDTQRLFASLAVEIELSDPYQPQQKGHVERVIRTFQHSVGPLLPGYIGHSVADRKVIEARKSFAARLGETEAETFGVSLTGPELQVHVDQWAEQVYQHRPHAGLKQRTPFEVTLASTCPVRRVDERALDLLLMPVAGSDGRRTATKFGIRIDNRQYLAPKILPGTPVFVRQDPNDLGRVYCFAEDGGTFLDIAICPETSGLNPQTLVRAAKEIRAELEADATRQIRADMRKIAKGPALIERALEVARRDHPNVIPLPKKSEAHTTPQIEAAIAAMSESLRPVVATDPQLVADQQRLIARMEAEDEADLRARTDRAIEDRIAARVPTLPSNVTRLPETSKERYRRALEIRAAVDAGLPGDIADGVWLARYEASAEFRAQAKIHADFGEAYLS